MHTNKIKAKVDFKFCIGSIPAMLIFIKVVLPTADQKSGACKATFLLLV